MSCINFLSLSRPSSPPHSSISLYSLTLHSLPLLPPLSFSSLTHAQNPFKTHTCSLQMQRQFVFFFSTTINSSHSFYYLSVTWLWTLVTESTRILRDPTFHGEYRHFQRRLLLAKQFCFVSSSVLRFHSSCVMSPVFMLLLVLLQVHPSRCNLDCLHLSS